MSVPWAIHRREMSRDGSPSWSSEFMNYIGKVRAPRWWQFEPITSHLSNNGHELGLRMVQMLHDGSRPGAIAVANFYGVKVSVLRNYYRETWDHAYALFHNRYAGVMCPFVDEYWINVAGGR